ncbi:MAG: T9SS type A sorting domain-containing protein [Ignavibacteria bacterium]|nr:T9SS type A sorting domain-containing protein [Ignavibacteria bacterium]
MRRLFLNLLVVSMVVAVYLSMPATAHAGSGRKTLGHPPQIRQTLGTPHSTLMNINNIAMWATDNGMLERRPQDLTAGVTFPRGTSTVVYSGGLVWGGLVRDNRTPTLRVGGQAFNVGTVSGRIISPGVAENPDNPDVRIYRIRRDWATADLARDASEYFSIPLIDVTSENIQTLRDQYRKDWMEWPWQNGAPYYERNGIPGYQPDSSGSAGPDIDEPGLGGADQIIWFVANDLDGNATRQLFGSTPIGLEMQVTCWAYNRSSSLDNVIFQRYRIIYKGTSTTPSTATIDSMYLAKWVDPDLGDFNDDFVGCSVDRSLGYAYNARPVDVEFNKQNLPPPVVGYDLFQGPRVSKPSSQARWNLQTIDGFENLPLTTFTYFTASTRTGDLTNRQSWWNILRGYKTRPISPPQCLLDPTTNACTTFELTGDPQLYHGWVDGVLDPPGDRRFAMVSGPFTLAFGDTQEVVVGLIAGMGKDNRDGISTVKTIDGAAQDAFNLNFQFPDPIPAPDVRVVELDNKIILDWESDTAQVRRVEGYTSRGYHFESYTVYQFPLPTSTREQALVYQPFDPTQPRYLPIILDKVRNHPLVNGQKYYFGITSTVYNPDPAYAQQRIESPLIIRECVPHSPNPGTVYPYSIDEIVKTSSNLVGLNDASVVPTFYDPSRPDGHVYHILFHRDTDPLIDVETKPTWDLIDSTNSDTLLRGVRADSPRLRVITRGFFVEVLLPLHGLKGVYETQFNYQPTRSGVFNYPNPAGNYMVVGGGTSQLDTIKGENALDVDLELRFAGDSSWALFMGPTPVTSRWVRVPYTAWQVGESRINSVSRQLYTAISYHGGDSVWRTSVLVDHSYHGKTLQVFYPITIINDSIRNTQGFSGGTYYDDAPSRPDAVSFRAFVWISGQKYSLRAGVKEAYIADLDGNGIAVPPGTTIRFERFKEVRNRDVNVFSTAAVTHTDLAAALREVELVNVFPNPYYGSNRAEINRFQKFVTFNHLPQFATIRIFNLSGVLVKTIRKSDETQFAAWDLNNENGLPAAGGMYLAHIELKDKVGNDLGVKTLKLMIVPENQSSQSN